MEYSISVKMNELWLHVVTQIRNIMMSYKSKSKKKEKQLRFHLHKVQKHATLKNILFRDANTIGKTIKKTEKLYINSRQ